uniref:Probable D-2-hydroxyglutarate dehydrogenase, mitochondrial n=1 Tax=Leersia perrieri TaxID=77586 RepID=A0A0D9WWC1_9ORYZ
MARRAAAGLLRRLVPLAASDTQPRRGMYPAQYGATNRYFSIFYWIQGQQHPLYGCRTNVETDDSQQSAQMNFKVQKRSFSSSAAHIQRNPTYSVLNSDDVSYFKSILGESGVVQDEDRVAVANVDWMGKYKGASQLLLLPKSSNEVSKILSYCNSRRLAVVPQGGNTGLVGGSVPVYDEVNGILTCEAGCVLENLSSFVENKGFIMPLDLGAKGSCHIGGNISTNAGGLRFIRYGSLHGNVLGLEVVLADGTVLDMLTTLRKDNTGYDLKHLFIGSEGSLGVVTKIAILTPAKLPSTNVAFLSCNDYISCQKLLLAARRSLGEILSAFEFMDRHCINLAMKYLEGVHNPLPVSPYNFYVLIETTGSDESYDKVYQKHPSKLGLSTSDMGDVLGYGHLGDGNLHLNIVSTKYSDEMLAQIEPFVYEWTSKQRGSISAEHGLGLMKAEKIHYSKSSEAVQLMASIKKLFDPNSILNPYKVRRYV